jgi:hypothetical protein
LAAKLEIANRLSEATTTRVFRVLIAVFIS